MSTFTESHILRLCLFLCVIIIIVIRFVSFLILCRGLCLLCLILLLLLCLLMFTESLPLCCKCICISDIIADDDIVKNGAALHLPEIESDEAKVIVFVNHAH